jgi:flagellar biosynthesis/type III secretory pathway M-ring protein FliF/YscJ
VVGATVTGWPALLIILAILAVFFLGLRSLVRGASRGINKALRRKPEPRTPEELLAAQQARDNALDIRLSQKAGASQNYQSGRGTGQ